MEFGQSVKTCFSKYATFTGRASRSELWWFYLFCCLVSYALVTIFYIIMFASMLSGGISDSMSEEEAMAMTFTMLGYLGIVMLLYIPLLLPYVAVAARRLHDTGRSGWHQVGPMCLLIAGVLGFLVSSGVGAVTLVLGYIGAFAYNIVLLIWLIKKSSPETNEYGEVPEGVYHDMPIIQERNNL